MILGTNHQGSRSLSGTVIGHLLRSLYQPRHQGRHGSFPARRGQGRRVRLLAPVAFQPCRGRGRSERFPLGQQGTRLEQVPRLHHGRGPLQQLVEDLPGRSQGVVRQDRAVRETEIRRV